MKQIYNLLTVLFISITGFSQIPTNGLVARYDFENYADGSGNNLNPCGGGGQLAPPLQLSNNPAHAANDSAAYFNGTRFFDTYCSAVLGEFNTSSVSISAWFKLDQFQQYNTIACVRFDDASSPYNSVNLYTGTYANGKLAVAYTRDGGTPDYILTNTNSTVFSYGTWYHAAFTYDANTATAKLFLNGNLIATQADQVQSPIIYNNAAPLTVGHVSGGIGTNGFIGQIDEVLFYDRALSDAEVGQIYGGNTPVTVPNAPANLTAATPNPPVINLNWTDNANNEEGFNIYRGTDPFNLVMVDDNSANDINWNDNQTGFLSSGTYYYKVCAYNNTGESCSGTAQVTINGSVGVAEIENQNIVSVHPNPTNAVLNIEVKENTMIKIMDVSGKTIETQKLNSGNNSIDVSKLQVGVYFIQPEKGGVVKFIRE